MLKILKTYYLHHVKLSFCMKRIFIAVLLMLIGMSTARAYNERAIAFEQLPVAAQEFLRTHFADLQIAYIVEDAKFMGSEYEVVYTDRTEVDFDSKGMWTSVERRYSPVPDSIVPVEIKGKLETLPYLGGNYIRAIKRNTFKWEVDLSNGLEVELDLRFNIIDIDD